MSNARNLSNLLGTGSTIATAKIADDAITSAKLADDSVVAAAIADASINAAAFANNAVSDSTIGTVFTQKFVFTNVSPNAQPLSASFTLSEAEAPLGSLVSMRTEVLSGGSAGDQYCYLEQSGGSSFVWRGYVTDWYFYSGSHNLFPIIDAGDRTFNVVHGTIAHSSSNDLRQVRYCGYLKIDGMGD